MYFFMCMYSFRVHIQIYAPPHKHIQALNSYKTGNITPVLSIYLVLIQGSSEIIRHAYVHTSVCVFVCVCLCICYCGGWKVTRSAASMLQLMVQPQFKRKGLRTEPADSIHSNLKPTMPAMRRDEILFCAQRLEKTNILGLVIGQEAFLLSLFYSGALHIEWGLPILGREFA